MLLRGEVNDPLGSSDQIFPLRREDMADLDLPLFASRRVSAEILGKRFLEHQGNAFRCRRGVGRN